MIRESEAAACAMDPTDPLHTLQNQLLIELLRKNINIARSSPTGHSVNSFSYEHSQDGFLQACADIKVVAGVLKTISEKASSKAPHHREYLQALLLIIQKARGDLANFCIDDQYSFKMESVRREVLNITKYILSDKQFLERMNGDYIERIANRNVETEECREGILCALQTICDVKRTLECQKSACMADPVVTVISNFCHGAITHADQNAEMEVIYNKIGQLSRWIQEIERVCIVKETKIEKIELENERLRREMNQLRELFSSQQSVIKEHSKLYEDEIARLKTELEASKATQARTTPPSTRKRRILIETVVAFTGLSRDPALMKDLTERITELGGRVHSSADFTSEITHILAPANYQSVRTMAAALSGKWIMRPEWILDSKSHGKFISEEQYGDRFLMGLTVLKSKTFNMTKSFLSQQSQHQMNGACCKTLIEPIGRGRVVDSPDEADYVLYSDSEERKGTNWIKLKEFIKMIPGH